VRGHCHIQHPATPDGGKLRPIPHQRQRRPILVGEGEHGVRQVLVEHPGLIDHQAGVRIKHGRLNRS
jgi:hypothetical protein